MKKLMVAIVSAASAMFAFGDLPHGADFEAEGFVVGESFTNYLDKGDGAVSEGTLYWEASNSGEEIGTIAEYTGTGRIGVDDVPDIYTNALTNAKYLQLDSGKNRLLRNIAEGGDAVPMSTGDGIYLDTLVKFSAASSLLDSDFESGDKLAIAYVGDLEEGNEVIALSNFVVRAGFVGELQPTNYLVEVANFDVEDWHRLTIRTLTNIDGAGRAGFKIYLDGQVLAYSTGDDRFAQSAGAGFADDTHTIFPSAVASGIYKETITAVAFAGNGSIDDVVFTTETPKFIKDTESVVATFTVDSGVTAISVQVGSAEPIVVDMDNLEAILPPGTDEFTVTATIDVANGYTFARMTYNNGVFPTNPATITGYAGGEIAITTTRNNFSLFDENDDPISGTYEKLSDALAVEGVAKIQLAHDYDALAIEGDEFAGYSFEGEITLDLAGNNFDGGDDSAGTSLFQVLDTFTIIDSVGGGKITYDTQYGYAIVKLGGSDVFIGAATGDEGASFDGKLFEDGFEGKIIKGNIDYENNSTAGEFAWVGFVDQNSTCGDSPVGGYWVVEPKGGSEPTTYAISWTLTGGTTEAAAGDFEENDTIVFTADTGKTLSFVSIDGTEIADTSVYGAGSYTYTVGTADAELVVTFSTPAPTTYAISWTLTGGTTEATAGDFEENDTIVFTAESGKTLSFVSIDGVEDSSAYGASSYTYTVGTADAVLVVTFTGSSYPSYIDDSTKQEKYDTWKSDMAAAGVDVGDGAAYEDAFLLNCKPTEVAAAKAAFKFTSISYDATEQKWVTATTTSYNEREFNGKVTVKRYSDVGCTTESETGTFFRAVLQ